MERVKLLLRAEGSSPASKLLLVVFHLPTGPGQGRLTDPVTLDCCPVLISDAFCTFS